MDAAETAKALFDALAAGDDAAVRDLCAPDLRARQNNGPPMSLETLLRFSGSVQKVVTGFHYAEAVRSATAAGFVEEHAVRGVLPDGRALDLAVCVVGDLQDGRIVALREYFDSAAAAALVAALR